MSAPQTIQMRYEGDGEFKAATDYGRKVSDRQYVVGEVYPLVPHEERSRSSHNHEFAFVRDAWMNLPERYAHEPWAMTEHHLRKYALIQCRFCDTQTYACGSRAEAERWASNLRPFDEYSVVIVEGTTVQRFTAQSQRMRAMGKKRFQESKQAIMDWLDDLIGVERGATDTNARRVA